MAGTPPLILKKILIRDDRPADADEIADLFHGAVHSLVGVGYSADQLEAWAPSPPDYAHWRARLAEKKPYVAKRNGVILGFIELEADGHIDCFYVHRAHQRQGVGRRLYAHLLEQADVRGIGALYVEASDVARPFFEREGFVFERTNRIERGGQILTNHSMRLERARG